MGWHKDRSWYGGAHLWSQILRGREQRQETCDKFKVSLIYDPCSKFQARATWEDTGEKQGGRHENERKQSRGVGGSDQLAFLLIERNFCTIDKAGAACRGTLCALLLTSQRDAETTNELGLPRSRMFGTLSFRVLALLPHSKSKSKVHSL